MEFRKVLMGFAIFLIAGLVMAGTVSYLSNTINATATVSSPTQLTATAVNGDGTDAVDLTSVTAMGGEPIVLNLSVENLSTVSQTGKYYLVVSPVLPTTDVTFDGTTVTSGDITTVDLGTTTITAKGTEAKTVVITTAPGTEPTTYSFAVVYNVA